MLVWVRALVCLRAVPLGAAGFEQLPDAGSHVPATWHWSLALQMTGLLPVQTPAWQVSVWVQALASDQEGAVGAAGVDLGGGGGTHENATWNWPLALQPAGLLPGRTLA